jgi:hypothetical protein
MMGSTLYKHERIIFTIYTKFCLKSNNKFVILGYLHLSIWTQEKAFGPLILFGQSRARNSFILWNLKKDRGGN